MVKQHAEKERKLREVSEPIGKLVTHRPAWGRSLADDDVESANGEDHGDQRKR